MQQPEDWLPFWDTLLDKMNCPMYSIPIKDEASCREAVRFVTDNPSAKVVTVKVTVILT